MKILVCDDDASFIHELERDIKTEYPDIFVESCSCVSEMKELCGKDNYDLAFVDIVLGEKVGGNGIDAAAAVMEASPDMRVVFITAFMEKYAEDIYKYPGYGGFISKPVTMDRIKTYITRRKSEIEKASAVVILKRGKNRISIPADAIIYFESDKRRLGVVLTREFHELLRDESSDEKKVYFYTKLQSIESSLGSDFVRTHQSFIINLAHSGELDKKDVIMDNGDTVPISRTYLDSVRRAYFRKKGGDLL